MLLILLIMMIMLMSTGVAENLGEKMMIRKALC